MPLECAALISGWGGSAIFSASATVCHSVLHLTQHLAQGGSLSSGSTSTSAKSPPVVAIPFIMQPIPGRLHAEAEEGSTACPEGTTCCLITPGQHMQCPQVSTMQHTLKHRRTTLKSGVQSCGAHVRDLSLDAGQHRPCVDTYAC
jgi:hypothetical protein